MNKELEKIAPVVRDRLLKHRLKARTVTVKIKYSDFKIITRSKSFAEPMNDLQLLVDTAKELLISTEPDDVRIRLLGISVSNFGERIITRKNIPGQLPLFGEE
jgi:DNA polymerase IV